MVPRRMARAPLDNYCPGMMFRNENGGKHADGNECGRDRKPIAVERHAALAVRTRPENCRGHADIMHTAD
jgi:hypothetical protein